MRDFAEKVKIINKNISVEKHIKINK